MSVLCVTILLWTLPQNLWGSPQLARHVPERGSLRGKPSILEALVVLWGGPTSISTSRSSSTPTSLSSALLSVAPGPLLLPNPSYLLELLYYGGNRLLMAGSSTIWRYFLNWFIVVLSSFTQHSCWNPLRARLVIFDRAMWESTWRCVIKTRGARIDRYRRGLRPRSFDAIKEVAGPFA